MTLSFEPSDPWLQTAKSLALGFAKTESIVYHLLLSRGDKGESFKWKLQGPRNSVYFSVNCLGFMANEVVPYPWVLPHNNYLGKRAKSYIYLLHLKNNLVK